MDGCRGEIAHHTITMDGGYARCGKATLDKAMQRQRLVGGYDIDSLVPSKTSKTSKTSPAAHKRCTEAARATLLDCGVVEVPGA